MKKTLTFKLITVLLLSTILIPVNVFAQLEIVDVDKDNDIFITSSVTGADRLELLNVMKSLDPEDRKNVVYIREDGSFLANRDELLKEFMESNKNRIGVDGKLVLTDSAHKTLDSTQIETSQHVLHDEVTLAYANPINACPSVNSGPFRRVTSTTGYSRLTADIYLPSKTLGEVYIKSGTNDKGYIYSGAVTSLGGIDFGLATNYTEGPYYWDETWGIFVIGGVTTDPFGNYRFGQTVFFKYYTPADNQAAVYVAGEDKYGNFLERTVVAQVTGKNFRADGTGMKIKRVTSIGQSPEDLTSGSYLKNVHWNNVKIGTTSGSEVLMTASMTSESCGYKTSNVLVDFISYSNEKVWVKAGTLPE